MLNQFKKFLFLLPQPSVKSFNALLVASSWLGLVISGCAPRNSANTNTTAQNVSNQTQEKTSLIRLGYQKGGVVPIARQRGELEKRLAAQNIKAESSRYRRVRRHSWIVSYCCRSGALHWCCSASQTGIIEQCDRSPRRLSYP